MRTIHKYPLQLLPEGHTIYVLPADARVLRFAEQRGDLFMWVDLDTAAPKAQRAFRVFGTGHELPQHELPGGATHRGSCEQGSFVWHLYEVAP